ncbi:molybdate ABC transporter substrate-binding protein [Bacterioplanoides pacificum]|uniref:Molybdate ABC transporter substrate-binding protein n=1 Tax=Bacterioplanoides pacificum TaxID=1171596 RepID=A0ABV7VVF8_9GAMM
MKSFARYHSRLCRRIAALSAVALLSISNPATSDELTIAVASNFIQPLQRLSQLFEQQSPHTIRIASGSSGKLYAQILHGAPYDIFMSADSDKPERLVQQQQAIAGSRQTYALGRLVLATNQPQQAVSVETLISDNYQRLAIANPKLAPYGAAAAQWLASLNYQPQPGKLVRGENIAQTYQFVRSGNADLGLIALSQVKSSDFTGRYLLLAADQHPAIRQQLVVLNRGADNPATTAFITFLNTPEARTVITQLGYLLP